MAIKNSGSLSITDDIAKEFGGAKPHSLSEYYREAGLVPNAPQNVNIPTVIGNPIKFSNFYGSVKLFMYTIIEDLKEINLRTYLIEKGWDGNAPVELTLSSGKYIWSDSTAVPALTTGTFPGGLTFTNNGFIMGKGGRGGDHTNSNIGQPGGPAILLSSNCSIINNGYIAGGGGGGGGGVQSGGGGGAGGGRGGDATDQFTLTAHFAGGAGGAIGQNGENGEMGDYLEPSHANANQYGAGGSAGGSGGGLNIDDGSDRDPIAGGGGGGRILPGTGVDAPIPGGERGDYPGGFGGGPGQNGGNPGYPYFASPSTLGGNGVYNHAGAGGGGWGAKGGDSLGIGGAAGISINKNGFILNLTGNESRVYGSII